MHGFHLFGLLFLYLILVNTMASNWRKYLEDYIKKLSFKDKRIIDIGGAQKPLTERIFLDNCEYKILDLPIPHEIKRKPDFELDIQDKFTVLRESINCKKFDVAVCFEVSEYWLDPLSAIKNISEFLKKDGDLYISFHWLYPLHKPSGEDYLRYSVDGAKKLLEIAGFKIESISKFNVKSEDYFKFLKSENYKPDLDNDSLCVSDFIIKAKKL